jgi:pilus assembly protein CpaC
MLRQILFTQTRPLMVAAVLSFSALSGSALARGDGGPQAIPAPAPVVSLSMADQGIARRLDLSVGRSVIVDLPRDAKEVFVANPKVANAVVRSTRKLFIIGQENGVTSIFVFDAEGRQIAALEVTIGRDLGTLRQTLRNSLPERNIEIKPAGDSILLTGEVSSASEAQQAVDIANAFVGVSGGMFASNKGAVINGLTIKGKDQVMLRVTVVEVGRAVLKQFGVTTNGSWSTLQAGSQSFFPLSPQVQAANNTITGAINNGGGNLTATLQAFERAGTSRILAEPTLTAISGESATFTAGGEVPVPSNQSCTTDNLGRRSCSIGTEFKPFGINLSFTPVVLSENRISLRVSTEVTELDYENQVRFETVNVPGIKVRRSATSVELPSGASMMTAGLLSQNMGHAVSGFPGLVNLPILGALFRSRDYQRRETELMIVVTPYIAKPMEPSQLSRPDDGFVESHDAQAILLGRLNRIYGVAGNTPVHGYRGRFGFIND